MPLSNLHRVRINYWEGKGLKKTKKGTKKYITLLDNLEDSITGTGVCVGVPVPLDKFKLSVDRFAIVSFDPSFRPVNKKKIAKTQLGDFIYNSWASGPFRSSLIHYTTNLPEPIQTINFPKFYTEMCQSYVENNGVGDINNLSPEQLENISLASKKLKQFYDLHSSKIDFSYLNSDKQKTDLLVRHALKCINENLSKFSTRVLTYNSVWETLPNFFVKHGYFTGTRRPTMKEMEEKLNAYRSKPKLIRTKTRPTLIRE